jgi:hypothetical protein
MTYKDIMYKIVCNFLCFFPNTKKTSLSTIKNLNKLTDIYPWYQQTIIFSIICHLNNSLQMFFIQWYIYIYILNIEIVINFELNIELPIIA